MPTHTHTRAHYNLTDTHTHTPQSHPHTHTDTDTHTQGVCQGYIKKGLALFRQLVRAAFGRVTVFFFILSLCSPLFSLSATPLARSAKGLCCNFVAVVVATVRLCSSV